jgi:type IV pilus assembly protein PilC
MGRKLPPITQSLIDVSAWLELNGPGILIGTVALAVAFVALYRWPPSRLEIDRLALRLPVFGPLFRLSGTVVFARALGTMLRAGVRILDALHTVEGLHRNRYLAARVAEARARIERGSSLAEPLAERFGFMPLLARMVLVGETSGRLDDMLDEMCRYHDELLQRAIRRMSGLIGPVVTVVVGGIVGFVYAAFLVAMFSAGGGAPK